MAPEPVRVLVVDDEPLNVEIILEYLEDSPYVLESAADGAAAWAKLQAAPDTYDAVLLDRMLPGLDGLEVLRRIKAHPVLQGVPVILQTALAAREEVLQGLQAGAYYCLTKPFDGQLLHSVLATAVDDRLRYRRLQAESAAAGRTLGLLTDGRFRLRTLEAARDLATLLANAFPDPSRAVIGLCELLVNAVEHGNLEISYPHKSELKACAGWEREIARRLADPRYADREVEVEFRRAADAVRVRITDQGQGFDWRQYLDMAPDRVFDNHGRGIAMARLLSFDSLEYRGNGNQVEAMVRLGGDAGLEDRAEGQRIGPRGEGRGPRKRRSSLVRSR
jgi:CheY-like chemotaxis protein